MMKFRTCLVGSNVRVVFRRHYIRTIVVRYSNRVARDVQLEAIARRQAATAVPIFDGDSSAPPQPIQNLIAPSKDNFREERDLNRALLLSSAQHHPDRSHREGKQAKGEGEGGEREGYVGAPPQPRPVVEVEGMASSFTGGHSLPLSDVDADGVQSLPTFGPSVLSQKSRKKSHSRAKKCKSIFFLSEGNSILDSVLLTYYLQPLLLLLQFLAEIQLFCRYVAAPPIIQSRSANMVSN
jgi:hypothetical protein